MKAQLILENGKCFEGRMFGATKDVAGEVIFTTGMVGYQETITDPAYAGQIVIMTFPLIGNYGIILEDAESIKSTASAIIVREKCDFPSNFRNEMNIDDFLREKGICGLEGIDTRALTQEIRTSGCMKGVILAGDVDEAKAKTMMAELDNTNIIMKTTTDRAYVVNEKGNIDVAVIDMGAIGDQIKSLQKRNCKVTVFPANASADEIANINPALVFVSNGPGNPEDAQYTVNTVKELIGKYPIFGISLGHLIIGLALGCKVEKLKFGHHGSNQPVKDVVTDKVYITSQNHNYVLSECPDDVIVTYVNVNDGSCEGIKHSEYNVQGIQFYPETVQSELDADSLFDRFLKEVR